jgi:hypothetical protein
MLASLSYALKSRLISGQTRRITATSERHRATLLTPNRTKLPIGTRRVRRITREVMTWGRKSVLRPIAAWFCPGI